MPSLTQCDQNIMVYRSLKRQLTDSPRELFSRRPVKRHLRNKTVFFGPNPISSLTPGPGFWVAPMVPLTLIMESGRGLWSSIIKRGNVSPKYHECSMTFTSTGSVRLMMMMMRICLLMFFTAVIRSAALISLSIRYPLWHHRELLFWKELSKATYYYKTLVTGIFSSYRILKSLKFICSTHSRGFS